MSNKLVKPKPRELTRSDKIGIALRRLGKHLIAPVPGFGGKYAPYWLWYSAIVFAVYCFLFQMK